MEPIRNLVIAATLCALAACGTTDAARAPGEERAFADPLRFELFFDVDRADLGDTVRQTLHQAVAMARKRNLHHCTVSIHPHEAGWDLHSQALAQQRAEAVRNLLVGDGMSAADIAFVAIGKDPLIATEDGIRDPANRRTELVFR